MELNKELFEELTVEEVENTNGGGEYWDCWKYFAHDMLTGHWANDGCGY